MGLPAFFLSGAKAVARDKDSTTFKLKDGHHLKVAHGPLKPEHRKAIQQLPLHKADGGDIEMPNIPKEWLSDANQPQAPTSSPSLAETIGEAGRWLTTPAGEPTRPAIEHTAPAPAEQPQPASEPTPQAPPSAEGAAIPQTGADVTGAYNQGLKGLKEQRDVEAKQAEANQQTYQSDLDAQQNLLDGLKRNQEDFSKQHQAFMQDLQNNQINPNHYLQSMSDGQKVSTAIGLFLGGLSSSFTHQGNPALEFLNRQIDRDIEAQKATQENKKTLLQANQNFFHDQLMANNATRMQLNDITLMKVKQAAEKLGTPAAQARYDQLAAQFKLQNNQLLAQNAIRATVLHSMSQGGQGLDALSLGQAGIIPEAEAQKEQTSLDAQKKAIQATTSLFDAMNKEQTPSNLLNPQSYKRADALHAELVNAVMNASASKRLTRESVEQEIAPLMVKTADTPDTRKAKLEGMLNIIGRHADPTPYMSKYAPQATPRYPYNQPVTKTMNGVTYTKGQGGWHKAQ